MGITYRKDSDYQTGTDEVLVELSIGVDWSGFYYRIDVTTDEDAFEEDAEIGPYDLQLRALDDGKAHAERVADRYRQQEAASR